MAFLVSKILEELSSIIICEMQQEVRLVVGVRKEVKKLTSNFGAIQAVLADAEERQLKDARVKHWLDQLKDISYDIDDVLDEWSTAILKLQIQAGDQHPAKPEFWKVCSFITSFSCFRCCEVGLRHDIAHKIKELNERLDDISKEKDNYNFNTEKGGKPLERQITASVIDLSEIKGREMDQKNVEGMLLSEGSEVQNLHVISVVGMGGIGKTTLAQLAYNNKEVKVHFEKSMWVCVSESFDEIRIAKAILESILGSAPNLGELENLLQWIHQSIDGKKFLLVLDDVWEDDSRKWKQLMNSLKSGKPGSKILVTTRKQNVAQAMGSTSIIQLGQLSTDESWSLFSQVAFYEKTPVERESLEDLGRQIVGRCKGLPLALKTLGGLLRFRNSREEWQTVMDSKLWELEETERDLWAPLWLSYYDLSSEMKQCFSYCSVFPKDYILEKDELTNLWMAQGYLREREGKEIEIVGHECFENLAARSFFQNFKKDGKGKIIKCKMHDIVHDFAQFLMKNECVSIGITGLEETGMDSFRKPRHLMVRLENQAPFPRSLNLSTLRSLLVESESDSTIGANQANLFDQSICLRALRFSNMSLIEVASEVRKLIHLRHLDLSNNHQVKELPESVCELYNLLTLDVSHCTSLEKLPQGIGNLTKLRHLRNCETRKLVFIPKGIGRLNSLRSLKEFVVSGGVQDVEACGSLAELEDLNQLRNDLELRGLGNARDVREAEKAQLKIKKHLSTLTLIFDGRDTQGRTTNDKDVLEALQPPPNLEFLEVYEYRGIAISLDWMISSTNLKKVYLDNFMNCTHLPPLGKLPFLGQLRISSMKCVKKVGDEFLGIDADGMENEERGKTKTSFTAFPRLKSLRISSMEEWEEWDFGIGERNGNANVTPSIAIMPCLVYLHIEKCPKLKAVPDQVLENAKALRLYESPILDAQYNVGGRYRHKLSHMLYTEYDNNRGSAPFNTSARSMPLLWETVGIVSAEAPQKNYLILTRSEEDWQNDVLRNLLITIRKYRPL